jgi:hypothetical protein
MPSSLHMAGALLKRNLVQYFQQIIHLCGPGLPKLTIHIPNLCLLVGKDYTRTKLEDFQRKKNRAVYYVCVYIEYTVCPVTGQGNLRVKVSPCSAAECSYIRLFFLLTRPALPGTIFSGRPGLPYELGF